MFIRQLVLKNLAFAAYRLPGKKSPAYVIQTGPVREFSINRLDDQKGFVIAPFDAYKNGKAFLIEPDFLASSQVELKRISALLELLPDKDSLLHEPKNFIINKQTYLQQIDKLVARIKKGRVQKVVLSRIFEEQLPPQFDFDLFFDIMLETFPMAFVYIFNLPGYGLWAGATPETLLKRKDGFYEIMALAGTQKRSREKDMDMHWGTKEIEEQAFVTQFVEEQLGKMHVENYEKSRAETVFAGSLAHICTRFRLPAKALQKKTGLLIKLLHPTPAVCGLPQEKAWQLIYETEKHRRRFYTGFLGPWQLENKQQLFVNLRCASFSDKKLTLFAGGGLTKDSVAEKEWQETEDKLFTLLSVVEKMRNFAP